MKKSLFAFLGFFALLVGTNITFASIDFRVKSVEGFRSVPEFIPYGSIITIEWDSTLSFCSASSDNIYTAEGDDWSKRRYGPWGTDNLIAKSMIESFKNSPQSMELMLKCQSTDPNKSPETARIEIKFGAGKNAGTTPKYQQQLPDLIVKVPHFSRASSSSQSEIEMEVCNEAGPIPPQIGTAEIKMEFNRGVTPLFASANHLNQHGCTKVRTTGLVPELFNLSSGSSYPLYLIVDPQNEIREKNEHNNDVRKKILFESKGNDVDLQIGSVSYTKNTDTLKVQVCSTGNRYINFPLSTKVITSVMTPRSEHRGIIKYPLDKKSCTSHEFDMNHLLKKGDDLTIVADDLNLIVEANESNNRVQHTVSVLEDFKKVFWINDYEAEPQIEKPSLKFIDNDSSSDLDSLRPPRIKIIRHKSSIDSITLTTKKPPKKLEVLQAICNEGSPDGPSVRSEFTTNRILNILDLKPDTEYFHCQVGNSYSRVGLLLDPNQGIAIKTQRQKSFSTRSNTPRNSNIRTRRIVPGAPRSHHQNVERKEEVKKKYPPKPNYLQNVRRARYFKPFRATLNPVKHFEDKALIKRLAAVIFLQQRGILDGYDDGSFGPQNPINRAESLKVLLEALGEGPDTDDETSGFEDVPEAAWFSGYVKKAKRRGIVKGYDDGTFQPGKTVNQVELLKMAFESFGIDLSDYEVSNLPEGIDKNSWFSVYLQYAIDNELLDEADINLVEGMTREMFSELIYRLIQQQENMNHS